MVKIVDHKIVSDIYLYLVSYDSSVYGEEWCSLDELAIHYGNYIELIDNYFDEEEGKNDFNMESDF